MQVHIEKLVYGGAGLARTERGVIFVPKTAPGDIVEIEIAQRKADYATGRVVSIVEPSPDRQTPSCPNYDSVGCCHWQHIRYSRQLQIKEEILRETLRRTAKLQWEHTIPIISGPDLRYRLRATFHVRDRRVGFVAEGTHDIVAIDECSALAEGLNEFIAEANTLLANPDMAAVREIRAVLGPPVVAAFMSEAGAAHIQRFGADSPRVTVNGFHFELDPGAFFQSNRFLLDDFMNSVLEHAGASPAHVLDLFCGSGFFSIPLARRAREVLAVESNPIAIRQARFNARLNETTNVKFFRGQVHVMLRDAAVRPDLIVVNPPRAGCGQETMKQIVGLRAARIVYVSCNPTTFAREAVLLLAENYHLERLTLLDQFPNTHHIELIASFFRS